MKKNLFFLSLFFFPKLISCSHLVNEQRRGIVISKYKFFNPKSNQYVHNESLGPDTKVWYNDSSVIERRSELSIETDYAGKNKTQVVLVGYTFIDLPTKTFCFYRNFSDTATMIARWTQADSIVRDNYGGVWNFYGYREVPRTKPPEAMSDTIILGDIYKRMKYVNVTSERKFSLIGYFLCKKKGTMFQYDKKMSEQVGCPMIRLEELPTKENPNAISSEIEFLSDKLTNDELKVFSVWEENAKRNPIKN